MSSPIGPIRYPTLSHFFLTLVFVFLSFSASVLDRSSPFQVFYQSLRAMLHLYSFFDNGPQFLNADLIMSLFLSNFCYHWFYWHLRILSSLCVIILGFVFHDA
jgi:hypothetical protein